MGLFPRRPPASGDSCGGIGLVAFPDGWTWLIPAARQLDVRRASRPCRLVPGTASAAAVLAGRVRVLQRVVPYLQPLLAEATLHSQVRVDADFSYIADKFAGPGWFLSGDAGCFLDPLLSTRVHLATYSATTAAACLSSLWRDEISETQAADMRDAANADCRVLTGRLLHAAERTQQQAVQLGAPSTQLVQGLDFAEIGQAYPVDTVADFELTTHPLGISRR